MVTFESKYNGQIQSLANSTQVTTYLAIRCFHLLRGFLNNNISPYAKLFFLHQLSSSVNFGYISTTSMRKLIHKICSLHDNAEILLKLAIHTNKSTTSLQFTSCFV